ncbi:MAG: hypothetical protein E7608_01250 [Ruminococcaceae bacterium]|nr:hypothetical protein [Oscillospiraceae bacterium]
MKRVFSLLLAAMLFSFAFSASAFDVRDDIDGIASYKTKEYGAKSVQGLADALAEDAGKGAEWYAISLCALGEYDMSAYVQALADFLSENKLMGTEAQRCALAFIACGVKSDYIDRAAENYIGKQGMMSYIWGLHLLNNGAKSSVYTAESTALAIIERQCTDGGFSITGERGDVDVTSMALCALAPHIKNNDEIADSAQKALSFLSAAQLENGGFKSRGEENSESAAQVITALCSLGIDPRTDARFIKNGNSALDALSSYKLAGGAYEHTSGAGANDIATQQALYALISLQMFDEGKGSFFIFEDKGDKTPAGFRDVEFERGNGEVPKEKADIKTIVCVAVIGVCALGIAAALLMPKKKKE